MPINFLDCCKALLQNTLPQMPIHPQINVVSKQMLYFPKRNANSTNTMPNK